MFENFPKKRILVFGDSNTFGADTAGGGRFGDDERYPRILEKLLGEDNYTVLEAGLSGRTAIFDDPLTDGLCGLDSINVCMMSQYPLDMLIIMLGTNDAKERFRCSAYHIARGILRLAKKAETVAAWRGTPKIVVVAPAPIDASYSEKVFSAEMGHGCSEKSVALFDELQRICSKEANIITFDAGVCSEISDFDGMHLSANGHAMLAKGLANFIKAF